MCACNKGKSRKYSVTYPNGRVSTVASLGEAISVARRVGGTYAKG